MFSEGIAQERLADLNPYWREIYSRGLFVGPKIVKVKDIARTYPDFKWPISRLGWQASTRTVNGGPAWAPPPKPLPKLTLTQRIQHKLEKIFTRSKTQIQSGVDSTFNSVNTFLANSFDTLFISVAILLFGYGLLLSAPFSAGHHLKPHVTSRRRTCWKDCTNPHQTTLEATSKR